MVEDFIFNLSNNVDVLETNRKIAEYRERNKDRIAKNRHKQSRDAMEIQDILLEETRLNNLRNKEIQLEEKREKTNKEMNKERLIDDLMFRSVYI